MYRTLDVKIVWFGRQVAVCDQNGIQMEFLGVVGFKSSTLTVYCLSSWFVHRQRKTYSNLCVLCWLSNLSLFQGPEYIPPSVWLWVTNPDVKSKVQKSDFLGHWSFTQLFHDVEKLRRKSKIFVKVIQRFLVCTTCGFNILKKSTRSSQSYNFGKILQCWKNLGMLPSSRFLVWIFLCQKVRQWLPPCVLHGCSHCLNFWQRNFWSKNDGNNNIFFCLKV